MCECDSELWSVVTRCIKESNKSDYQPNPRLQLLNHVTILTIFNTHDNNGLIKRKYKESLKANAEIDLELAMTDSFQIFSSSLFIVIQRYVV
jgi:hypothetical protein